MSPQSELYLAQDKKADKLLASDPFALVIGMVLDQQVPLERAFSAPQALRDRLGGLSPKAIAALETSALVDAFSAKPALHRFPVAMAARVQQVAVIIVEKYGSDTASIWNDAADAKDLLARVRALPGFGEQKARIFIALLGKQFNLSVTDWPSVTGAFGKSGTYLSVADIKDPLSLERVREHKRQMKAAAKSVAPLEKTRRTPRTPAKR